MSILEEPIRAYPTRGGAALAPQRRVAPGPAPEIKSRHLRVVAPVERVRRRLTPAAGVLFTGLLFVTLFAIAISHALLVQGQIRLDDFDGKLSVEQARYEVLRKEVAEMESPSRVVAAAQGLGMVAPDDLVYLQPAPEPSAADGRTATPGPGSASRTGNENSWSVMKPLLDAPAP